ncbi:hypothetical protein DV736_g5444, partial [Chaetothyriales sp. CBS 134916]
MPKNKGKGGKNRRRGKNENDNEKRELTFKEEGQEYAQVVKMLGNGRLEALCFDGERRLAHIRGKLRKKVWINQGDIILLSLRDYQDDKGDVILKYSADEARSLKAYGELPENAKINETDTYGHEGVDDNIEFDEDRDSAQPRRSAREVIFSGIQPTGIPHLGNYLGALRQWKDLQEESRRKRDGSQDSDEWEALYFSVVDLHALTGKQTREERWKASKDSYASLLAIGLDPAISNIFFQSHVPQHSELTWILSTIASTGYLSRMTQWKSKLELPDNATLSDDAATERLKLGLFSYPVLQAADVLVHGATTVPVGEDQSQHIEFARSLARSFNAHYGDGQPILLEPKSVISRAKRIMSLRDPSKKMSKSHTDPKSRILITDTEKEIRAKVKGAVTDNEPGISYDPQTRPGVSNLVEIIKHVTQNEESCQSIAKEYEALSKNAFKELVADEIIRTCDGFRDRFEQLRQPGNKEMEQAIFQGGESARANAAVVQDKIRKAIGLY